MRNIILEPSEVWDYFENNVGELHSSYHLIASNDEYGAEIYITVNSYGEAQIIAELDGDRMETTTVFNAEECEKVCRSVYDDYLTPSAVSSATQVEYDEGDMENEENLIEIRESELDDAVYDFLMVALDGEYQEDMDAIIETAKEHFLEFIAREMKLPVYRPMHLADEDGEEFFSEYPYECMVFDDEVKVVGFE